MIGTALEVACSADEQYAQHCAAMLHSLLTRHPRGTVRVHFLHSPSAAPALRRRLERLVRRLRGEIRFHPVADQDVSGLPVLPRIPVSMWYRIFLPELLPDLPRVLYLDVDTLIIEPLDALWHTSLEHDWVAAVTNVMDPAQRHWPLELGLARTVDYFNSGVLLLNLRTMREADCTSRLRDFGLREGPRLRFPDQDALNVVLGARRHQLHPRWNCMNSLSFFSDSADFFEPGLVQEAIERPAIVHFEGPAVVKPWHFLNRNPHRQRYYAHLRGSRWPARLPEGMTLHNIAKIYLPEAVKRLIRPLVRLSGSKR